MAAQSSRITVLGDEYPVKGDVDAATTQQVADYVNQKAVEVRGKGASLDKLKIAVLSALNIAGELFEYRSKNESNERRLKQLQDRAEQLAAKIDGVL